MTDLCDKIREEMGARNITMTALGATYNMIHPDVQRTRRRIVQSACVGSGL